MRTSLLPVIIAFFSIIFCSCQKEPSNPQAERLKMIRWKEGDSLSYASFQYDAQNRVIAILYSNNNGHQWDFAISYDGEGKISQVSQNYNASKLDYTILVDSIGRIIKKSIKVAGQQLAYPSNTYNYDTNGKLIGDSIYSSWTGDIYHIVSFAYDQNANVVQKQTINAKSGAVEVQEKCVYDNHLNPLYSNRVAMYLLSNDEETPAGKNNLLKEVFGDGTFVDYSYEYYSNGLPKKCSFVDDTDPLVTYIDYYYE
jgi:hypothetical protein